MSPVLSVISILIIIMNGLAYGEPNLLSLAIEMGLEQAPFVVFVYFFPHLNM